MNLFMPFLYHLCFCFLGGAGGRVDILLFCNTSWRRHGKAFSLDLLASSDDGTTSEKEGGYFDFPGLVGNMVKKGGGYDHDDTLRLMTLKDYADSLLKIYTSCAWPKSPWGTDVPASHYCSLPNFLALYVHQTRRVRLICPHAPSSLPLTIIVRDLPAIIYIYINMY